MKKKNSFIMKNEKKNFRTEKNFDGLLPILWTGLGCWACRRWAGAGARGVCWVRAECAGRARSAQAGVRGRAGEGVGVGAGRWALAGAHGARRRQQRARVESRRARERA